MDSLFSEEQRLLKESIEHFSAGRYQFDQRQKAIESASGYSEQIWQEFAELGWLGLPIPETDGGFGGSLADIAVLMEGFGGVLVVEPYVSTVLLSAQLLTEAGSPEQRSAHLPRVVSGHRKLALAHVERQSRFDLADVKTEVRETGDGFVLSGQKSIVLGAAAADYLLISARSEGGQRDETGLSLFLVAADAPGLSLRSYLTQDGHRAADITLENVEVDNLSIVGAPGKAFPAICRVVQRTMIALSAEAVGAMGSLNGLTFEHLRTREQFGAPIGSFQSLQHRAVEMEMAHRVSQAMVHRMARTAGGGHDALAQCASACKAETGRSGKFVGQQAIQLHGGIGMTDEYSAGHYFKRITMIDALFGNADYHLSQFASRT